jgi:hypothetical protein
LRMTVWSSAITIVTGVAVCGSVPISRPYYDGALLSAVRAQAIRRGRLDCNRTSEWGH